jgi:hypothetical protein
VKGQDYTDWVGPLPEAQQGTDLTQLQQYDRLKDDDWSPRMVVMSLGGNDSGFSTIGVMCLAPGDCQDKSNLWLKSLNTVEAQLDQAFAEVRATFEGIPVLVTAYPDPILDSGRRECDDVALSFGDREFIEDFGQALNARIYRVAKKYGFHFLGEMEEALADGLKLCDPAAPPGGPGINFVGLRSTAGSVEQRFNPAKWTHNSLHPNESGHEAMREVFEGWWARNTSDDSPWPPAVAPANPDDAYYEAVASLTGSPRHAGVQQGEELQPSCTLLAGDDIQPNCRSAGTTWALRQVSTTVLANGWGILGLVGLVGAWLLTVSLLAGLTGRAIRSLARSEGSVPNAPRRDQR